MCTFKRTLITMLTIFIKALIIGIAIAAPVGPIGLLCIRKTLELGIKGALSVGMGAALADTFYGLIVGTGLTTISHMLLDNLWYIKLLGGVLLLYLAIKEATNTSISQEKVIIKKKSLTKLYGITFILTLTNPMTILSFIAIFPSISDANFTFQEAIVMIAGIFIGSLCWWIILGSIITYSKQYLPNNLTIAIRLFSALVLAVFGLWTLGEAILKIIHI